MSIEISNNDVIGIAQFGAPEMLDFWTVVQESMGGTDFFRHDAAKADELDDLIADKNRIHRQAEELKRLMPHRLHRTDLEYRRTLDGIEQKIAKVLGRECVYKKNL